MAPTEVSKCEHCGRTDPQLFKVLTGLSNLHANLDAETGVCDLEETLYRLTEQFEDEDGDRKLMIAKVIELVKNPPEGYAVRWVDIGSHDSAAEYLMESTKYAFMLMEDDSWQPEEVKKAIKVKEIQNG